MRFENYRNVEIASNLRPFSKQKNHFFSKIRTKLSKRGPIPLSVIPKEHFLGGFVQTFFSKWNFVDQCYSYWRKISINIIIRPFILNTNFVNIIDIVLKPVSVPRNVMLGIRKIKNRFKKCWFLTKLEMWKSRNLDFY